MLKKPVVTQNEEGVVLVMVLLVLVATILIGIAISNTSFFEAKVVGNDRISKNSFYAAEGAGEYVMAEFDSLMSTTGLVVGTAKNISTVLPTTSATQLSGATVSITLTKKNATPPIGSKMSVLNTVCNYYKLTVDKNDQSITMGIWKTFPVQQ